MCDVQPMLIKGAQSGILLWKAGGSSIQRSMLFGRWLCSGVNSEWGNGCIIVPYQKLFMSFEEQEEHFEDFPFQSLKIRNQNTTICVKPKCPSEVIIQPDLVPVPLDCSFERGIHLDNMEVLRSAAARYLQESLGNGFDKEEGFRDSSLYENLPFEMGGLSQLQMLTQHNELLTQREQQELLGTLRKQEELLGLIRQAVPVFGITVGRELVFAIYHLLKQKLEAFREIRDPKEPLLIPRLDCFQGFQDDETIITTSCPLYEDLNLQEVPSFAEKDLEELSSMLYFSWQIKYLNLRDVQPDTQGNVLSRFNTLIKQLSKTVFFTLSGAIEPSSLSSSSLYLDLSREVSFSELSEAKDMTVKRSLNRPFVQYDEEPLDVLNKKRKRQ